jgi:lysophospholipase L1-like esterase
MRLTTSNARGPLLSIALLAALAAAQPAAAAPRGGEDGPRCPNRTVSVASQQTTSISLRCRGLHNRRIRIARHPRHGLLGRIDQQSERVTYRADDGYQGADRLVAVRKRGKRKWTTVVRIEVGPADELDAAPDCAPVAVDTNYQTPAEVAITCRGDDMEAIEVGPGPFSGTFSDVTQAGGADERTLTATYTPDDLFSGQDAIVFTATDADGSTHGAAAITVEPWRMWALGDSVTASFGYFANGSLMTVDQLLDCKPAAVVSNRCSSNSPDGPNYAGPPRWTADYGLANDVSWAAQFANSIQGGGHVTAPQMFRNYAVTGSAPSDWLDGGILNPTLESIVAADPDLIAMTMGANPLLTDVLLTTAGEECAFGDDTVAELEACLAPFFAAVDLTGNLQSLYTALLEAPHAEVVTFEYSLSIPAANLFDVWQLEVMIDYFNDQIASAVTATKAALPAAQADRLHLISAQRDPGAPSASLVPRFNIGLPPAAQQSWTAPYDCGDFFTDDVDGPSHQSEPTRDELWVEHPDEFCSGPEWIIDADSGIHPNALGYTQFADTLASVAAAEGWVPPLP